MSTFQICFILYFLKLSPSTAIAIKISSLFQMIGILTWVCLNALQHVAAQSPGSICPLDEPGPQGWVGPMGPDGPKGEKGDKGESASSVFRPPPGTPCHCPEGLKGEKGDEGPLGAPGSYILLLYGVSISVFVDAYNISHSKWPYEKIDKTLYSRTRLNKFVSCFHNVNIQCTYLSMLFTNFQCTVLMLTPAISCF